jgi:signal transduction histidine kinase
MKLKLPRLAKNYQEALRQHLVDGAASDLSTARKLGVRAVNLGVETLDLAKIHEAALLAVVLPHHSSRTSKGMVQRCVAFFAEAATPMEETHRGALEAGDHLKVMLETLTVRTIELASSNEELKGEVARRREVEKSLRISELTTSQLLKKSRQMQEELRQLSRRLLAAQEEERRRISRDLHDVVAQTLTGINLRLSTLKTQTMASARDLHTKIGVTQRLVQKSVEIVHRFARNLRPTLLDDLGLIPALKAYLEGFMEQRGIRVTLVAYAGVEKLPGDTRTVLFRVVQEALANVGKHSQASQVRVRIHDKQGTVCMEIHDNGRGFAVEGARFGKGSKRLGLLGMRERVEMVGGTFSAQSAPGKETTLRIEIPPPRLKPKKIGAPAARKPKPQSHR